MAFQHGKSTKLLVNGTDLSAYFNDLQMSGKVDTAETTTFAKSAKTYIVGVQDGSLSAKGYWDGGAGAIDQVMAALVGTGDNVLAYSPSGSFVAGTRIFGGQGIETEYTTDVPVSGVVSITATFQADGGMKSGVSLQDVSTAVVTIASFNSTGVLDLGWGAGKTSANGLIVLTQLTAISGTGTPAIQVTAVQSSDDNSTWASVPGTTSFAAMTAVGAQSVSIPPGTAGTLSRYFRVQYTTTGSTISANLSVCVVRL